MISPTRRVTIRVGGVKSKLAPGGKLPSETVSESGVRAWQYGTIPRGLWIITEAQKGYFGLETVEFQSLPLGSFSRYLDPKLLITLSFLPSAGLAAGPIYRL